MIIVILLGIIAVFFAWLESTEQSKQGLRISFGLIFIFLAIRYNYGSDYTPYFNLFQEINRYPNIDFFDKHWRVEPGWVILNWVCSPIGFFGMTIGLALFNCYIYYKFFKRYIPQKYYWFAVLLYIFDPSYMLTHLSAMRQCLSILLFILSLDYLYKKKIIQYVVCIIIASFFHYSALILLPFFIFGLINIKINFKIGTLIVFSYILLIFFVEKIFPQMALFVNTYFEKYSIYEDENQNVKIGLGFLISSIFFIVIIYFNKFQNKEYSLLFKIGLFSFLVVPLSLYMQLLIRLGMYFQPTLLVIYPVIFMQIKDAVLKKIFISVLIFMTLYNFKVFHELPIYIKTLTDYQTIFSSPEWN